MGFMGLKHLIDSDTASDFAYEVGTAISRKLHAEMKRDNGQFNTSGVENAALFFESAILPVDTYDIHPSVREVAKKLITRLEKNYGDNRFRLEYSRMLANLRTFLKRGAKYCE